MCEWFTEFYWVSRQHARFFRYFQSSFYLIVPFDLSSRSLVWRQLYLVFFLLPGNDRFFLLNWETGADKGRKSRPIPREKLTARAFCCCCCCCLPLHPTPRTVPLRWPLDLSTPFSVVAAVDAVVVVVVVVDDCGNRRRAGHPWNVGPLCGFAGSRWHPQHP